MSTSIYYVVKELKRIYLEDSSQMSETAKYIRSIKETAIDAQKKNKDCYTGETFDEKIDRHFKKRISSARKAFEEDVTVLKEESDGDVEIILPKPTFKAFEYNKREVTNFFKAYIEELDYISNKNGKEVSSRKAKYLYDYNVDLDKKYDFVYRVLWHDLIKPQRFSKINDNFNEKYNEIRSDFIEEAKSDFYNDEIGNFPKGKLYRRYVAILESKEVNYARYVIKLANSWLCISRKVKCGIFFENVPWGEKGTFRVLWKLWMWIWIQTVQYLALERIDAIDDNDLRKLRNKMKQLEQNIEQDTKPKNNTDGIFEGYFKYNFLLLIRDEIVKDAKDQRIFMEKGNKHYALPEKLCFVRRGNVQEEWVNGKNEATMQEYFDFGEKKCSTQTFKSRISFCKKFIKKYNDRAGRTINNIDWIMLRAVYRAFFIDEIKVNRRKLSTIAKDIIQKDHYEGMLTEHYALGNVISNEGLTEYYQGERILRIRDDLVPLIYSIGLEIFYRYFPSHVGGVVDFQESLNILEFYFTETVDAVYESFYK